MDWCDTPHHDGSGLFVDNPEPALGDRVTVRVRVPDSAGVTGVHLRSTPDGEPAFAEATVDKVGAGETWWRVDVSMRNPVTRYRFLLDGPGGARWLSAAGLVGHDVPDQTDFQLVTWSPPPAWSADAVIYQIFPDRFSRSDRAAGRPTPPWAIACDWDTPVIGRGPETPLQFYGGDLDGIVDRLDHLRRLGVNTIYLTPIFPSRSNHRYDAASFDHVDPALGGDEALARLAGAVHASGMRIISDLTTNHCGASHPWFTDALADPAGPDREMFYFRGDDYESWQGVASLPKLNWGSARLRRHFFGPGGESGATGLGVGPAHDMTSSIATRWLTSPYDVDGWRVDVANMTGRCGPDSFTHEVARLLRRAVHAVRPDALVVAEHAHDAAEDLDADGWHATMNYSGFTRPVWSWLRSPDLDLVDFLGVPGAVPARDAEATAATMRAFGAGMSWRAMAHSWTITSSHDTARIRTVAGDPARAQVAVGLQMTLPGVPMIFAGDELGLTGRNGEESREPMPWHRPQSWDQATLRVYEELIRLRRDNPALRHGGLRWVHAAKDTMVFLRETVDQRLLVLARRATGPDLVVSGLGEASLVNVYGGAQAQVRPGGRVVLPGAGPTTQVWHFG